MKERKRETDMRQRGIEKSRTNLYRKLYLMLAAHTNNFGNFSAKIGSTGGIGQD